MMLSLCREYDFRLHIVHLSSGQALPELRAARSEGLPVSVETCPHYLHLAAEDYSRRLRLYANARRRSGAVKTAKPCGKD